MTLSYKIWMITLLATLAHGGTMISKLVTIPVDFQLAELQCVFNATDLAIGEFDECSTAWKNTESERDEILHLLKECKKLNDFDEEFECAANEHAKGQKIIFDFLAQFKTESGGNVVEFLVEQAIDVHCLPYSLRKGYF